MICDAITPDSIEHYQFRGIIGEGASAIVMLAYDQKLRTLCACKVIPKTNIQSAELAVRFENEVRILQQLRHPGVIQLHNLLQDENNYYLFMELCSNGELYQYILENQKLSELESKYFLRQIFESLQYVHSIGVIHRDLKPENILLTQDGRIKLTDFGLSRFVNSGGLAQTPCGSLCYASPECIRGPEYDGRKADIWSCGVILYAMVVGRLPWTERNQSALYEQIQRGQYFPPTEVSKDCQDLIRHLLDPNVKTRYSISDALNHPWLRSAPEFPMHQAPSKEEPISLRQLDRFFGRDVDEADFPHERLSRSISILNANFEDTVRNLAREEEESKPTNQTARNIGARIVFQKSHRKSAPSGLQYHLVSRKRPPSSCQSRIHYI